MKKIIMLSLACVFMASLAFAQAVTEPAVNAEIAQPAVESEKPGNEEMVPAVENEKPGNEEMAPAAVTEPGNMEVAPEVK